MRIGIILLALGMFVCMPEVSAGKKAVRVEHNRKMLECCCSDQMICEKCVCVCRACPCAQRKAFCEGAKHTERCPKTNHTSCAKTHCRK